MSRFLTSEDFSKYVRLSRELGKIVVVTDRCGCGKSTARNQYVCDNVRDAPRLVVEKIPSCDQLKTDLIKKKPKLDGLIGVYHSHKETSDNIAELYDSNKSKPISIITHARLGIDNVRNWMFTDSVIAPYCQTIIIDEMPNDLVFTINISTETIVDRARRLDKRLGELLDRILFGKQRPMEAHEILNELIVVESSIREYVYRLIKYKSRLADAGIITNSSSNAGLIDLERKYIEGENGCVDYDLLINRLLYQFHMIYFAILSGRFKELENGYLACSVLSPLYTWNALHDVATLILDGTGQLEMYPEDLCFIAEPKIKPRSTTILPVKVNGNPDKRFWIPKSDKEAEALSNHFYLLAKGLLETASINGNIVYLCTWMDKAKSQLKREFLINEEGTISIAVNSAEVDVSFRKHNHVSKIVREYWVDSSPRKGRRFKKDELNAESAVYEAAKGSASFFV